MTSTANWWERLVLAFLSPFTKISEDKLRLQHAIDSDKIAVQQRHIETILDSQKDLANSMKEMMADNNSVIKDWLEGFHKLPVGASPKAPPVNDDERMWKLEMQELARQRGQNLQENMTPYEMEAYIQRELSQL